MRWATLAATVSAAAFASAAGLAYAQAAKQDERPAVTQNAVVQEGVEPAQELRVTSPPNAAADRTYDISRKLRCLKPISITSCAKAAAR